MPAGKRVLSKKQRNLVFRTTLAERARWLRQAHKLSLRELGRRTGLSDGHLSRVERGKAGSTIHTLICLCQFYSVTSDYMLGYDGDEAHARAMLDAKGRLVYFRPEPADRQRKCTDCSRLLIPGTLHTMQECITFSFHNGRNASYLVARWGLPADAIELIVKQTLDDLPYLPGH